jgi:hypothetical protein
LLACMLHQMQCGLRLVVCGAPNEMFRCSVHFGDNWEPHYMLRNGQGTSWAYRTAQCPCCAELTVEVSRTDRHGEPIGDWVPVNPATPVAGAPDQIARRRVH